jgi:F0F1-type ATP synthase assembly protein I
VGLLDRKLLRQLGLFGVMGSEVALCVVVLTVGGSFLDKAWHTSPAFTLVGMVLGCGIAGLRLAQVAKKFGRDERPKSKK